MIEVLIAMVVLAFGILGLANLMAKMHQSEAEAYQRAQALMLLQEMSSRFAVAAGGISAPTLDTPAKVDAFIASLEAAYVPGASAPLGTGDSQPSPCPTTAGGAQDLCLWSNDLKGSSEVNGSSSVGAMIGARGCIEQIQPFDTAAGVCTPGIFRVSVAWQGLVPTTIQNGIACGAGSYGGDDSLRRVVSTKITIGLPKCS